MVATGHDTELGRVSQLVAEAEPGSSPIEKKLARLSAQLVWATLVLAALIAGVGLATGKDAFLMAEAAIALAVAAIPEGLPIVATLALARGMWRMARQNALIERLSAVETLGATTVILTDKTGTLTENRMTVRRFWLPSGEIEVDGDADGDAGEPVKRDNDPHCGAAGGRRALQRRRARAAATRRQRRSDGAGAPARRPPGRCSSGPRCWRSPDRAEAAFDPDQDDGDRPRHGERSFAVKGAPEAVLAAARCHRRDGDTVDGRGGATRMAAAASSISAITGCACSPAPSKSSTEAGAPPYEV